jgi:hypothetical protein
MKKLADPSRADDAEDRGGADVHLEAVERVGQKLRGGLREDHVDKRGEPASAAAERGLHRAARHFLEGLGIEAAEDARGVDREGQRASEGPQADGEDEAQRPDHLGERAPEDDDGASQGVEHATAEPGQPPGPEELAFAVGDEELPRGRQGKKQR